MSDLSLLRTFLAVYRSGTVTGGAAALHLSQPAVTAHVHSLETFVGEPLFTRTPRGAEPTRAGHALARRCEAELDSLEALLGSLGDEEPLSSEVWIGGPAELMGEWLLPRVVPSLDPGARVRTWFSDNDTVLDGLVSGELDVAILTDEPGLRSVTTERFGDEVLQLVASPQVAAALPRLRSGAAGERQLRSQPVVAFDEQMPLVEEYWQAVFRTAPAQPPAITATSLRAVALVVASGTGVTVLPDHLTRPLIDSGELVTLLDPPTAPRKPLIVGWRSGDVRRTSVAHVRDVVLGLAGSWNQSVVVER